MVLFLLLLADIVQFQNGDRLSGEIQKLENRRLTLKTAHAGTVTIDWDSVARVSSDRPLRLETSSGKRLDAPLRESQAATMIAIGPVSKPGSSKHLPAEGKLAGHADFGYNLTRGNTSLDQSSFAAAEYRMPAYRIKTEVTSLFSGQPGAADLSKHSGSVRLDYFLTPKAFSFGLGGLDRDDRENLRLRGNFGGGLGWKIVQSPHTELSLLSGATFVHERFARADPGRAAAGGEGLAALTLDKAEFHRVQFTSRLTVLPNLIDSSRYRVTFDGGVRVPLASRFTWGVRLFSRYDSRPQQDSRREDYGLIQSFAVRF